MPAYAPPIRDTRYILDHVLKLERYASLPGFESASPEVIEAVLEEGGRFCAEVVAPLNASGDAEGCTRHADGRVTTPMGFRDAWAQFVENGWPTLGAPEEHGGQGMPHVVSTAFGEFLTGANHAFAMYNGLTAGAIAALSAHGTPDQIVTYVPRMASGEWAGTMALTEAQCGTDLGLIRTRAEPQPDGSFRLTGEKIFISGGDQDLTANIVHLVLARIAGAPEGTRGLSLFVAPKRLPDTDALNAISCGSVEEKMGVHGNATCVLNFDGATGWLVGEAHKGLAVMFILMNAARLEVGLQGVAQGERALQTAIAYARERRQGRAVAGPHDPAAKADPIIVHADVRRMLLEGKALVEGGRALCLWTALQVDLAHAAETEADRAAADTLVALLTPVIKAYLSDAGFRTAVLAQQVLGGHGYIREWGVEQAVRDARVAMIYEGANGVQAMDLVGRKLVRDGGAGLRLFVAQVEADLAPAGESPIAVALGAALSELDAAARHLLTASAEAQGAAAYPFLELLGTVALGWMWLKMASSSAGLDDPFHQGKVATARFMAEHLLPQCAVLRRRIECGDTSIMALPAEAF